MDNDDLRDDCEVLLAQTFMPELHLHWQDECPAHELYWAANVQSSIATQSVRIFYALAYAEDCGDTVFHVGDSEWVSLDVLHGSTGWAMLDFMRFSHHGSPTTYIWHDLEYVDETRGRPRVYVSRDKHANYPTSDACNGSIWSDTCIAQAAFPITWATDAEHNLGSSWAPMKDCVFSNLGPAVECFWSGAPGNGKFNGWQDYPLLCTGPWCPADPYSVPLLERGM